MGSRAESNHTSALCHPLHCQGGWSWKKHPTVVKALIFTITIVLTNDGYTTPTVNSFKAWLRSYFKLPDSGQLILSSTPEQAATLQDMHLIILAVNSSIRRTRLFMHQLPAYISQVSATGGYNLHHNQSQLHFLCCTSGKWTPICQMLLLLFFFGGGL